MLILFAIFLFISISNVIYKKSLPIDKIITNNRDTKKHNIQKNKKYNRKEIFVKDEKCHISSDTPNLKISHFIITRFMIEFYNRNEYPKKLYKKDFISNAIRVMKNYLFPSLEFQSCRNFTWILMIGNKANIDNIKNLFNFNYSFPIQILYEKDIKTYLKNNTKGFDILITTRIDYDDRIYYDAVNDVRKEINIYKPMLLYGYNRGFKYYESINKYVEFNHKNNIGSWSVFISLITVLNKVNDIYTIYDMGGHLTIKLTLLKNYKSYGIQKLNYDPAIFDNGTPKFVWIQQKYSGSYNATFLNKIINKKSFKTINFDLNK